MNALLNSPERHINTSLYVSVVKRRLRFCIHCYLFAHTIIIGYSRYDRRKILITRQTGLK